MTHPTPILLALDQGTTSSRSMLFDAQGCPIHVAQQELTQHYPHPGWVEHDATEIWCTQRDTLVDALTNGPADASTIAAIGITNQRETTVLWDRHTGEPVHHAIVWQDRRTADTCHTLADAGHESLFRERTGLRLDPYFSGTKLAWLLDHVDGARTRAETGDLCFGTIDSWLLWNLTDGKIHATDPSNASRTLLFNIHTGDWDDDLLRILRIPRALLPEVRPSSGDFGVTAGDGLPQGIPIRGIAGDQHAALFGQTCFSPGEAKNTYGTGCFLLMNTGTDAIASTNNLLTTVAWDLGEGRTYALEGSVFIGGAVVQWLRDELQLIASAAECSSLAAEVNDANGLLLIPAFAGLGAPHWDPHARGLAIGITRGTTKAHWCRAALEGIAFQSAELFAAMQQDAPSPPDRALRVDGGATASEPLMQFQADLLQRDLHRPAVTETTARGAALLAGLGAGVWDTPDALLALQADARTVFSPQQPAALMQEKLDRWKAAVERCKGWES